MDQVKKGNQKKTVVKNSSFSLNLAKSFERFTINYNNILHKISGILLLFLMFLISLDVGGRFFFNFSITGAYEITELTLTLIVFYSLGTAQLKNNHIEIDYVTKMFSEKVQDFLRSIISFVLFLLVCLIAWQMIDYTLRVWSYKQTEGDLEIPLFIFSALTVLGIIAFALSLLLDSLKALLRWWDQ